MFNKKTVFVIGAGASVEFGMPSGERLKSDVASLLNHSLQARSDEFGRFESILANAIGPHSVQKLLDSGHLISDAMPTFISIDEVLHYFSDDPAAILIGKFAITYVLLSYEAASPVRLDKKTRRVSVRNSTETWLHEFLSIALSFAKKHEIDGVFKNVTFINFNYDRIVEQYLVHALQEIGAIHLERSRAMTRSLEVVRPYGSLGKLPWQENGAFADFGLDLVQSPCIDRIAPKIRTYTEQMRSTETVAGIQNALRTAELVIVIGFGFHQQNMAILKAAPASRPVFATAFGIDPDNHEMFSKDIAQFFGLTNVKLFPKKGYEFMNRLRPTISAAAT